MLLREEPRFGDQSLTDVAFYCKGGMPRLKMLYRSRLFLRPTVDRRFPKHDEFSQRITAGHTRPGRNCSPGDNRQRLPTVG